jgi:hypothetical protein
MDVEQTREYLRERLKMNIDSKSIWECSLCKYISYIDDFIIEEDKVICPECLDIAKKQSTKDILNWYQKKYETEWQLEEYLNEYRDSHCDCCRTCFNSTSTQDGVLYCRLKYWKVETAEGDGKIVQPHYVCKHFIKK